MIHFAACGCGEKTILFPPFKAISALYMTVEVGLVEGINPATTPTGTPTSITLFSLSSFKIPTVRISLISSRIPFEARAFFKTLSCHLPNPVSSAAILAKRSL